MANPFVPRTSIPTATFSSQICGPPCHRSAKKNRGVVPERFARCGLSRECPNAPSAMQAPPRRQHQLRKRPMPRRSHKPNCSRQTRPTMWSVAFRRRSRVMARRQWPESSPPCERGKVSTFGCQQQNCGKGGHSAFSRAKRAREIHNRLRKPLARFSNFCFQRIAIGPSSAISRRTSRLMAAS